MIVNNEKRKAGKIIFEEVKSESFSRNLLDSLCSGGNFALVILGYDGCDPCDVLYSIPIPDHFPVSKCFVEKYFDEKNVLLSQALHTTGFPTSYVIDSQYNIIGIIRGVIGFTENLRSVVIDGSGFCNEEIEGITASNVMLALSYSLKSLLSYCDVDYDGMYTHASKSLSFGSCFFSNYMLYKYFSKTCNADSCAFYRHMALNELSWPAPMIYRSLIEEIDTDNHILGHLEDKIQNTH